MHNSVSLSKMAARAHRKGFSPTLPSDGWHEDRDGPWESYKERCVREGAQVEDDYVNERIIWGNDSGQPHREDGPYYEDWDGHKEWWVNGRQHREDGPAVECANGAKAWYVNGQLHRLDGPAFEHPDGSVEFYKDGFQYTDITFTQRFHQ